MTWFYNSKTGEVFHPLTGGIGVGYSGTGLGRNNTDMEGVRGVGPIPRGRYRIGKSYTHTRLGPVVMNLDPVGHDSLGRSLFRIHGDNLTGDASEGCIILNKRIRKMIANSNDKSLLVV